MPRGRRSRNYFSDDQIKRLKSSPFTYSITRSNIVFTPEFKKLFYIQYMDGKRVKEIFIHFGYDPSDLGDGRMYNFASKLSKDVEAGINVFSPSEPLSDKTELTVKDLQAEVTYLRQQMEFLKKISSIKETVKSEK